MLKTALAFFIFLFIFFWFELNLKIKLLLLIISISTIILFFRKPKIKNRVIDQAILTHKEENIYFQECTKVILEQH